MEKLSLIWNSHRENVADGWREIAHMEVGQCGN
jgi:hypothetical protein